MRVKAHHLLIACLPLPALVAGSLLMPRLGEWFDSLKAERLGASLPHAALGIVIVTLCAMLDRSRKPRIAGALMLAVALLSMALASAHIAAHLYAPAHDIASLGAALAVAVFGSAGIILGARRAGAKEGLATAAILGLLTLPPLFAMLTLVRGLPAGILREASPSWVWAESQGAAWWFGALGVAGFALTALSEIRIRRRARRRSMNRRPSTSAIAHPIHRSTIVALVGVAFMAAGSDLVADPPPMLDASVRFLTAPGVRRGESVPVVIGIKEGPVRVGESERLVVRAGNGPAYVLHHPPPEFELAVFVPRNATVLSLEVHGLPIFPDRAPPEGVTLRAHASFPLPETTWVRDDMQRLVAVFSPSVAHSAGMMGERMAPRTTLLHRGIGEFPRHWSMLTTFDALILPDAEHLEFDDRQLEALADYLATGGVVAVIGGFHFPGVRADSPQYAALSPEASLAAGGLAPGEAVNVLRYSYGSGILLQLPPAVLRDAGGPAQSLTDALEAAWRLGPFAGYGDEWRRLRRPAGPPPHIESSPVRFADGFAPDFAARAAAAGTPRVLFWSLLMAGALLFAMPLAWAARQYRRTAAIAAAGIAALAALTLTVLASGAGNTRCSHLAAAFVGRDTRGPALITSYVTNDPQSRDEQRIELARGSWPAPLGNSGQSMRIEFSLDSTVTLLLQPGASARCDLPARLGASDGEPLFRVSIEGADVFAEGRRPLIYTGLARALSDDLLPAETRLLEDWLERRVYARRNWELWMERGAGGDWLPVRNLPLTAPGRLVYRYQR